MKIAIHHREKSFSDRWIEYCKENNIEFKLVNCYASDILDQVKDCSGLMWHWHHTDVKAVLFAKQLALSLERIGVRVFPDVNTVWHFDDKVGQKYLLEAINAPSIPSYVFYDKREALEWARTTSYPKVFKLRGGAGAMNVQLIKSEAATRRLINKAFGKGFSSFNGIANLKERWRHFKRDKNAASAKRLLGAIVRLFVASNNAKLTPNQKGYVYFQDFMPKNNFDTRLLVIGNNCFAVRRYNRENDFRASGSGIKGLSKDLFDKEMLNIAFETSEKIGAQCIAYDFIYNEKNQPVIIEISYGSPAYWYDDCPGCFNRDLEWRDGKFKPQYFMMEDFIASINERRMVQQ